MVISFLHLSKVLFLTVFLVSTAYSGYINDLESLTAIINETMMDPNQPIPSVYLTLDPFVAGRTFYGEWVTSDAETPSFFSHSGGFSNVRFSPPLVHLHNATQKEHFMLKFFDGEYIDNKFIMFVLPRRSPSPTIDWKNMVITSNNITSLVLEANGRFSVCHLDMFFSVKDTQTGQPLDILTADPESDNIGIQIAVESSDCGIRMETTVMTVYDTKIMSQLTPYAGILFLAGIINALAYAFVYSGIRKCPSRIFDVSLPTLNFFATFDFFIGLDHLHAYVPATSVRALLQTIGFVYIASILFLGLIFMIKIKVRLAELPWRDVNKKLLELRIICLPFVLLAFILTFVAVFIGIREKYYLTMTLFLLPQIIQNAMLNRKYQWNYWYIGAMFLPKVLYFLYMEGYSNNVYRRSPHLTLCCVVLVVIAIQMFILAIQTEYPRLVSRGATPYKMVKLAHCLTQNCPICLQDFDKDQSIDIIKPVDGRQAHAEHQIVVTPCNHEFHLKCLKDWFTCKFECPYCRTILPFSMDFDDHYQMSQMADTSVSIAQTA